MDKSDLLEFSSLILFLLVMGLVLSGITGGFDALIWSTLSEASVTAFGINLLVFSSWFGNEIFWIIIAAFLIITLAFKLTIPRPRPHISDQISGDFLLWKLENSFPSGHTAKAFACSSSLIALIGSKATPILILGVLTALSRVFIGVHYASDVVAGALLGVALTGLSVRISSIIQGKIMRYLIRRDQRQS